MASIVNSGQTSAKNDLAELFDTLQQQRTTLIDQVRTLELVARPLFQLEAERLKAKVGPDDPRVQALAQRADNQLELIAALQVESDIAAVRVPSVERDDTLIDGRLIDANQRAVADTQVQLVDEKGQAVAGATVTTDASGYYSIVLTPEASTALKDKQLFVAIGTGAAAKVPAAAQPISVVPGGRVLQQIGLNAGELSNVRAKIDLGAILDPTPASAKKAAPAAAGVKPTRETEPAPKKPAGTTRAGPRAKKKPR